jgi:ribonucleotide monophosphatase NagD (HAD superfamily)
MKVIAVDFDGTLVKHLYPHIGEPIQENIDFIKYLQSKGWKLILWTCRCGEELQSAVTYMEHCHNLKFDTINDNIEAFSKQFGNNSRKVYADIYFDDRASFDLEHLKKLINSEGI